MEAHKIALFDLDKTLLDLDSEGFWTKFLIREKKANLAFGWKVMNYQRKYEARALDVREYEEVLIQPMLKCSPAERNVLLQKFLRRISPHIRPQLVKIKEEHEAAGHQTLLITSSNSFIVQPVASLLQFQQLICTKMEVEDDHLTGKVSGEPPYQAGKVTAYQDWLKSMGWVASESWFYSDSANDLPLLSFVDHPVAVAPDPTLKKIATEKGWQILEPNGT